MRELIKGKELEVLMSKYPRYEVIMVHAQDLEKDEMPKGFELNHANGILYLVIG